ncbi:MAG: N-acetylglucosamine-6-phosphate deacetylase [bacterium]|nr:N-acetylglucosamine-6-phosphate deacetylase [bacterium]
MWIEKVRIFSEDCVFRCGNIEIEGERFGSVMFDSKDEERLDSEGLYAIPGLCDIHFHACDGMDFCDGTTEALSVMAHYEAFNGITSICPASMTLNAARLLEICKNASKFTAGSDEAALVGINLEGPFLSYEKRGAQNPKYLIAPDAALVRELNQASGGLVKLISLAPELPGSMEFIQALKNDFILSAAHTTADYTIAKKAFDEGMSHVTHLYNAMLPFSHRAPGLIGAAYDTPDCKVELICDGIHVDPAAVRMTFSLFGDDRIVLISDSMMAAGLEDGTYSLGGQTVNVHGNLATLADGTIAGSVTNLYSCMTNAVNMGVPLESAVKCATMNPAKEIGIYEKAGSITPGKFADLLLLNPDLSLHSVFLRGRRIRSDKQS